MTYTAPEILLFIAALGGIVGGWITAWRTGAKTSAILTKAEVIHDLTNNTHERLKTDLTVAKALLADVKAELVEAKAEISTLRALVAQLATKGAS